LPQAAAESPTAQPIIGSATNGQTMGAFGFWSNAFVAASVYAETGAGMVTAVAMAPNPAARETELRMTLAQRGSVAVTLHDVTGRRLAVLFDGDRDAGTFVLPIDVASLASGSYYLAVSAPGALIQQRLTVVH
jgi:hypothetical protein